MPISKYQKQKIKELKEKAYTLYKQGLTTREVGAIVKRSHEWVANAIKEMKNKGRKSQSVVKLR